MTRFFNNKTNFLKDVAKRAQLREGPAGVETVIRAIYTHGQDPGAGALTERVLSRITRLPVPVIISIRRELEAAGMLEPGLSIQMSPTARQVLADEWGWFAEGALRQSEFEPQPGIPAPPPAKPVRATAQAVPRPTPRRTAKPAGAEPAVPRPAAPAPSGQLCDTCGGSGILPHGAAWDEVRRGLAGASAGKPRRVSASGEQVPQPSGDTNLLRAAYMHEKGALAGKDVLVMGGDASVAAAVALAGKALAPGGRLARRIVALHPDERVLRQLRDIAVAEGVIIGLVTYSPEQRLMPDLQGDFDTVFLDAPATYDEFVLLLSRAIDALRESGGQIYLSLRQLPPAELLEIQRVIGEAGLLVLQLMPSFEAYSNGPRDLYLLQTTDDTVPLAGDAEGESHPARPEQAASVRLNYACTACGTQIAVGGEAGDQFASLAALEQSGCPACGNPTFHRLHGYTPGQSSRN